MTERSALIGSVALDCRKASEDATGYCAASQIDWEIVAQASIASVIAHATSVESVRRAIVAWDNKAVASDEAGMKAAILAALNERQS